MSFLTGSSGSSWQPVMTADTTTSSYWLNWRVLLCALWVLIWMVLASILISKYEVPRESKQGTRENSKQPPGLLYEDEVWRPCLRGIHPAWLLGFRVVAFFVLLMMLILDVSTDGGDIMYFYTQWTFTLVTVYFGLGSLLSIYGCYQYHNKVVGDGYGDDVFDAEQGSRGGAENLNAAGSEKGLGANMEHPVRKIAGFWGYVFQIMFQMNGGAVMLTDSVFWFILVPFLTIKDYGLNILLIFMHTMNLIFLLGETALNSLRFPWFRISYFFLWTVVFVIFQWILHACTSIWWPYPFLDLSSPFAPLWYLLMAFMQIPCYGVFTLVIKMKHYLLAKWFPQSYQRGVR